MTREERNELRGLLGPSFAAVKSAMRDASRAHPASSDTVRWIVDRWREQEIKRIEDAAERVAAILSGE